MVDPESVRRRLREIDRRVQLLRGVRDQGRDAFDGDIGLRAQAERHLQLAIQSAIDIAMHLIAERSAATPDDYASAFSLLADAGLVDPQLAARLRLAVGLRNILVHGYLDVDPEQLWSHLSRLGDLEAFAAAVDDLLAR